MSFSTPILYLVFNRPDLVVETFQVIKVIKPRQLFIASDGPRGGKPDDKEKIDEAKKNFKIQISDAEPTDIN